jgi:hypothetical protein
MSDTRSDVLDALIDLAADVSDELDCEAGTLNEHIKDFQGRLRALQLGVEGLVRADEHLLLAYTKNPGEKWALFAIEETDGAIGVPLTKAKRWERIAAAKVFPELLEDMIRTAKDELADMREVNASAGDPEMISRVQELVFGHPVEVTPHVLEAREEEARERAAKKRERAAKRAAKKGAGPRLEITEGKPGD